MRSILLHCKPRKTDIPSVLIHLHRLQKGITVSNIWLRLVWSKVKAWLIFDIDIASAHASFSAKKPHKRPKNVLQDIFIFKRTHLGLSLRTTGSILKAYSIHHELTCYLLCNMPIRSRSEVWLSMSELVTGLSNKIQFCRETDSLGFLPKWKFDVLCKNVKGHIVGNQSHWNVNNVKISQHTFHSHVHTVQLWKINCKNNVFSIHCLCDVTSRSVLARLDQHCLI